MAMHLLDLLNRDTQLLHVASTRGGEYAGPCPFCGGSDRFRAWPDAERPGYWCRQCGRRGDAIQYLCDHDGFSYQQACHYLGITPGGLPMAEASGHRPLSLELDPPNDIWQKRAEQFCHYAVDTLWSHQGTQMRAALEQRGLTEETIREAAIGYNPADLHDAGYHWGLEAEVWLPGGLVIPCRVESHLWRVVIRPSAVPGALRYVMVHGSIQALYRADQVKRDGRSMILESELDALLIHQEAGDLVTALATGGTGNARHLHWLRYLATPREVLISTDADEAGDLVGEWWIGSIPHSRRWRPLVKNPSDMQALGLNVRQWVQNACVALPAASQPQLSPYRSVPIANELPPAPLRPVESLKVIEGNPGAVRKLAVDPDSQPKLSVITATKPPVIPHDAVPPVMRPGEAIVFLNRYGQRHDYTAVWNGQLLGAPGDEKKWKQDIQNLPVADLQRCATEWRDQEQGQENTSA